MTIDKRTQRRFEVDAAITIVAVESSSGHIQPKHICGNAINVSASGALIELSEPVSSGRIWMRLAETDASLSECVIVRTAGPRQYGVQFKALWPADTIQKLLKSVFPPRAVG